jgi:hypothetical protein
MVQKTDSATYTRKQAGDRDWREFGAAQQAIANPFNQ